MRIRFILFAIIAQCASTISAKAQSTASIKGVVTNIHNQGIANISLSLKGTTHGANSDNQGNFIIKNIPAGNYTFIASAIGFDTYKKQVTLRPGQALNLYIQLSPNIQQLKEIEIVAKSNVNPYSLRKTNDVAKMPLKRMNNPQSYTTLTPRLMQEQLTVDYAAIFKNISGTMTPLHTANGRLTISVRGFETKSQTKDGMTSMNHFAIDPVDIERIEVIKGPSATLYGNVQSSYGGVINIITKKPYNSFGGNASYSGGSFGLNRLTFDLNTPLNKKKTLLFRINAAGEHKGTYKDAGYDKSIFVAPSLKWKMNKYINVLLEGDYYNFIMPSPFEFVPYAETKINNATDLGLDEYKSFNPDEIPNKGAEYNIHARINEKISKTWSARTDFVMNEADKGGYKISYIGVSDSTLARNIEAHPNTYTAMEAQQNFDNTVKFGKFKNKFLLGLDFSQYTTYEVQNTLVFDTVNFQNPGKNYYNFTQKAVSRLDFHLDPNASPTSIQKTYAAYGEDNISFNDRLSALISLRFDNFNNENQYSSGKTDDKYSQNALSSKFGLVYQIVKDKTSLFGNYLTGFQNVHGNDFDGNPFKPQNAVQYETGIKVNLCKHRFTGRVSVYDIQVTNILREDPDHIDFSVQNGNEESKGLEVEIKANPFLGLNILAGFSHNDFEYKNISEVLDGRRSPTSGPENTANLWLSYNIYKGKLKGLGLGVGGNYGSQQQEVRHFEAHSFYSPAYNTFDATIFYRHDNYRIALKANNITDEKYYTARLNLAEPRNFVGQVTFMF